VECVNDGQFLYLYIFDKIKKRLGCFTSLSSSSSQNLQILY